MSEKLKELLERINQEGLQKAEQNAGAIETKAKREAEKIVSDAKSQARTIVDDARDEAKKTMESSEASIRQAGRDLVLSLKEEIRKIFDKIVSAETKKAISPEEMAAILGRLIERYIEKNGESSDIKVLLKKDDLEELRQGLISRLKQRCKDGIEFRPSPNINAGFCISFDKGKSYFDFTDEGLVEALCAYLNPELAGLLKV